VCCLSRSWWSRTRTSGVLSRGGRSLLDVLKDICPAYKMHYILPELPRKSRKEMGLPPHHVLRQSMYEERPKLGSEMEYWAPSRVFGESGQTQEEALWQHKIYRTRAHFCVGTSTAT